MNGVRADLEAALERLTLEAESVASGTGRDVAPAPPAAP